MWEGRCVCRGNIQGTTEKIKRVLSKVGVKVAMKPFRTIDCSIPSPKDPISPNEINCLVQWFLNWVRPNPTGSVRL